MGARNARGARGSGPRQGRRLTGANPSTERAAGSGRVVRGFGVKLLAVAALTILGLSVSTLVEQTRSPGATTVHVALEPPTEPGTPAAVHPTPASDPPRAWLRERGEPGDDDAGDPDGDVESDEQRATSASATTTATRDAPETPVVRRTRETIQDRGEAALARIRYPWESLGFTIRFEPPREGLRGVTYNSQREIRLYVRLSDPIERTAHDLAHEIGHAVDIVHMDRERRDAWLDARGAAGTGWWSCDYCEDRGHGSGDFAEVFALWQVGPTYFGSRLAGRPSDRELERLTTFFGSGDDWRRHYGTPVEDDEDDEEDSSGLIPCVVNCR